MLTNTHTQKAAVQRGESSDESSVMSEFGYISEHESDGMYSKPITDYSTSSLEDIGFIEVKPRQRKTSLPPFVYQSTHTCILCPFEIIIAWGLEGCSMSRGRISWITCSAAPSSCNHPTGKGSSRHCDVNTKENV